MKIAKDRKMWKFKIEKFIELKKRDKSKTEKLKYRKTEKLILKNWKIEKSKNEKAKIERLRNPSKKNEKS